MSTATKSAKQRIVQYHRGGKSRVEIARLVGCSAYLVDATVGDYEARAPKRVKAYKCGGCFNVVVFVPCQVCRARGGK